MKTHPDFIPITYFLTTLACLAIWTMHLHAATIDSQFQIDASRKVRNVTHENGLATYHFTVTAKRL